VRQCRKHMNLNSLPVNAFDVILLVVLLMGIFRGRRHGMSEEMMHLIKWIAVVVACGYLYDPIGHWVAQSSPFSLLASYLMVYSIVATLILVLFSLFQYYFGGKLVGSDIFGRSEYYLGMASGLVRFGCMLLAALALLNARYFSSGEVMAMKRVQDDLYGSNYFPTWHGAQEVVFEKSVTGPFIKNYLGFLLIKPTQPEDKSYHQREVALP
jgi:uncharacterized membrane protein required for colicin V production